MRTSHMKFMVIRGHYMGIICEKRKPEAFIFNMNVHIMPTNVHEYLLTVFGLIISYSAS